MSLPDKNIQDLKRIFKDDYGVEMTDEEARKNKPRVVSVDKQNKITKIV